MDTLSCLSVPCLIIIMVRKNLAKEKNLWKKKYLKSEIAFVEMREKRLFMCRIKHTVKKEVPISTCRPWNPVAKKSRFAHTTNFLYQKAFYL